MRQPHLVLAVPAGVLGARIMSDRRRKWQFLIPLPYLEPVYDKVLHQRKSLVNILSPHAPPLKALLFSSLLVPSPSFKVL